MNIDNYEPQSPGAPHGRPLEASGAVPAPGPSTEQMFQMMKNLITSQVQEIAIGIRTDIAEDTKDLYNKIYELNTAYSKLPVSHLPRDQGQASTSHEHNRADMDKRRTFSNRDLSKPEKYTGNDNPEDFIATFTHIMYTSDSPALQRQRTDKGAQPKPKLGTSSEI